MNLFRRNTLTEAITPALLSLVFILIWASLFFGDKEAMYVAAPLFSCALVMVWLTYTLWKKDGGVPFFDIGFICALATFVYSVVPLLDFWVTGLRFGLLSDGRLAYYDPSPSEMGMFHWRHVLYLATFAVTYSFYRSRLYIETGGVELPGKTTKYVLISLFCVLGVYFALFELVSGFRFNVAYSSEDFDKNVALISSIPLLATQISFKLYGIYFVVKLAILWVVIQQCRSRSWRIILWIWILYELIYAFQLGGARTGMALFLLAAALMYHRLIGPFSLRLAVPAGILLLALFTFMGILRQQANIAEMIQTTAGADGEFLSIGGEFSSLLGTAYDVYQRTAEGITEIPWYLYLNDFINILPPQQILPFEKVAASEWYLREVGLSGTGLGFMWGVITQSIVGLDWLEIALRGGILGFFLAKIHSWYARRREHFLTNIFYIYLCVMIYYTFRDTTGSIFSFVLWGFVPFFVLLRAGIAIFSLSRGHTHDMGTAISAHHSK